MKVLSIVGARPQFVKLAPVSRAMTAASARIEDVIVHTGQHYDADMSEVFFEQLEIPEPAINLEIGSGPHGQQTARMLEGIETVIGDVRPDIVAVYGDTNSTAVATVLRPVRTKAALAAR